MAFSRGRGQRIVLPPGAVPASTEPRYVPPPAGYVASGPPWPAAALHTASASAAVAAEREQSLPSYLSTAIDDLQQAGGCGNLSQVLHLLVRSETAAHRAAVAASKALAELNARTTQLRDHPDILRRAKRARLLVRDRAIWRCFGHQGSIFDCQRVQDFVFTHVTHTDINCSQLTNAYQSILGDLLEELVLTDAWRRLINSLRHHPNTEDALAITTKLRLTYAESLFVAK